MPAPRRFTRERLQSTALAIVDERGLAGLTMRSLAAELGTGAMTIYNYVDGRTGLEALVTEAVMAKSTWEESEGDDWREALAAVAEGVLLTVWDHPNAVPLMLARGALHESALAPAEAMLDALHRAGYRGPELLVAFRVVSGFVSGFAQVELAVPPPEPEPVPAVGQGAELDGERFPRLVEIGGAATASDPLSRFRDGLRIILKGLEP
ncbi:TetR/AcrR family transcriptional regulator C-terminal domain-containing protein [Glycomyces sp. NPDC047010]|uniref:TetR/AcrR family transcriptional regulator n=1 Tax=Glycomyces sp. NPDC047010 TaxID=3155023 RepID=UPI0033F2DAA1